LRSVLDPSGPTPAPAGNITPSGPIPPAVRKFGFLPDVAQCQPGDLFLFSACNQPWISKAIVKAQTRGGYGQADACWHHAAVYAGQYMICEAQGRKVRVSKLYEYVGSHRILIRRDTSLNSSDGREIAMNAMAQIGDPYGFFSLLQLGWQSLRGFWRPLQTLGGQRAVICSKLYADAYAQTTGKLLVTGKLGIPTPASLSLTNCLTDVKVDWLAIS
jgi:cell wall-associated NlpC family hydrolase